MCCLKGCVGQIRLWAKTEPRLFVRIHCRGVSVLILDVMNSNATLEARGYRGSSAMYGSGVGPDITGAGVPDHPSPPLRKVTKHWGSYSISSLIKIVN